MSTSLVLGAGLGLNLAMFSVVRAALFHELPIHNPEEIVYIYSGSGGKVALESIQAISGGILAEVTSHDRVTAMTEFPGETRRDVGDIVPANYVALLGIKMAFGRGLTADDGQLDNPDPALVLSHHTWSRVFRGDPDVLGMSVKLDGRAFVVVGIAEEGFGGLAEPRSPASFWTTPAHYYGPAHLRMASYVFGRLRPGVSVEQAAGMRIARPDAQASREGMGLY